MRHYFIRKPAKIRLMHSKSSLCKRLLIITGPKRNYTKDYRIDGTNCDSKSELMDEDIEDAPKVSTRFTA